MKHIKSFCLATSFLLATSAFAQTVQRPAPASSYTTARAIDNFVRQAVPDLSGYAQINQIPGIVSSMIPAAPPAPSAYGLPWTAYFVGQSRCTYSSMGYLYCGTINGDGSISMSGQDATNGGYRYLANLARPSFFNPTSGDLDPANGILTVSGVAAPSLSTGQVMAGSAPTDWNVTIGISYP